MANESSAPSKPAQSAEGSVKETIESILVAFILAFIFRAFVVEAFVIPTGSMGPTLMGAHFRMTCPDCGYQFEVNYSSGSEDDTDIPSSVPVPPNRSFTCPNCGYPVPVKSPQPVYFGDRILVLKYKYLFQQPQPWDVVVFKSPYEKHRDPEDPKYPDNYIKRLVARPNQSVMILDGDVYIGSHGMPPQQFKIQRKPRHAQNALWRDIYNNDYLPSGLSRGEFLQPWQEPWIVESGTGWKGPLGAGNASRIFTFDNLSGASAIRFDSTVNHPNYDSFDDWLAYDQPMNGSQTPVSDLNLSCMYRRTAGSGPLRLQLTKRGDCFTAEFLPGKVVLHRDKLVGTDSLQLGGPVWAKPMEASVPELSGSGPVEIEFTNVDYRVAVRVNGREVLATDDATYTPDVAALYREALQAHRDGRQSDSPKPMVRIEAAGQTCSLEHLRLARDVYYLNNGRRYNVNGPSNDLPFWASPENIMELGPDEYFVLGDNSQVSLDARFWGAPVNLPREGNYHAGAGRVPGRFLLGKAFFVYWPAGYRPPSVPYGVEPDFGDMRLIH
ncbi:MAG TPA: S26 family signal peptidase [Tepidisphaeraceae bacterium]|nr:S26 family signal peptidase [Tepidisphaeraceae bacterium]